MNNIEKNLNGNNKASSKTIEQELEAMGMEDYELFLKRAAGSKHPDMSNDTAQEHSRLLDELQREVIVQDEPMSLGRANNNPPVLSNSNYQDKGSKKQTSHQYYPNHSSTFSTIKSTSTLTSDSVGGDIKNNNRTANGGVAVNSNSSSNSANNNYSSCCDENTKAFENELSYQPYFRNEVSDNSEMQNGYLCSRTLDSPADSYGIRKPQLSSFNSSQSNSTGNPLQLPEDYPSVASLTTGGSSAPSLINSIRTSQNHTEMTRSLTPNFATHNERVIAKSPSEGSNTDRTYRRALNDRVMKKKPNKGQHKETTMDAATIPGHIGHDEIENILKFVEGKPENANVVKKGKKKDAKKEKETLVKSASLDESHLNSNVKRASSEVPTVKSSVNNKILEKKTEKSSSEHVISSLLTEHLVNINPSLEVINPTAAITSNGGDIPSSKKVPSGHLSLEEEKPGKEEAPEAPFELVQSKKKKARKSMTQREAETFSRGNATEQSRREQNRARRNAGDRRKSVGSVPASENEAESDDDSVRSLPAGECTPKERVPKQCSSSGGTPQTSYADIARISDANKVSHPSISQTCSPPAPMSVSNKDAVAAQTTAVEPVPPKLIGPSQSKKTVKPKAGAGEAVLVENSHMKDCCNVKTPSEGDTNSLGRRGYTSKVFSNKKFNSSNGSGGWENNKDRRESYSSTNPTAAEKVKVSNSFAGAPGGDGKKVLIEDKTEFPDINSSLGSVGKYSGANSVPGLNNKKLSSSVIEYNNVKKINHNNNNINGKMKQSPDKMCENGVIINPTNILLATKDERIFTAAQSSQEIIVAVAKVEINNESSSNTASASPAVVVNGTDDGNLNSPDTAQNSRARNSSSVSSSSTNDVPVIFCGNNFEREILVREDLGLEFGFDVMSMMFAKPEEDDLGVSERDVASPGSTFEPHNSAETGQQTDEQVSRNSSVYAGSCSSSDLPLNEKPDSFSHREKTRSSSTRESLLGTYPGQVMTLDTTRRSSQPPPYQPHQRNPRGMSSSSGYRNQSRNGANPPVVYQQQQQHPFPQVSSQHIQQNPVTYGPPPPHMMQQVQGFPPPPQMMAGNPYGPPQMGLPQMPRGPVPMGHPQHPSYMIPNVSMMYSVQQPAPINIPSEDGALSPGSGSGANISPNSSGYNVNRQFVPNQTVPATVGDGVHIIYPPVLLCIPQIQDMYFPPIPPCPVPVSPSEVESWMNLHVQRVSNMGIQGQLNIHRLDD